MLKVKRRIYYERFQKHLEDLNKHLTERDYVQAAEKVWGAISSLVNAILPLKRTGVEDKKEGFENLFRTLSVKYSHLRDILKKYRFRDAYDFATKASGLHEYFYGGRDYPENYLKDIIEGCARVLEEVNKVSQ